MAWFTRINWVDVLFVIIVLKNTYAGSQRGFFSELFHILAACFAVIFSIHFYFSVARFFSIYLFIPLNIGNLISFFILSLLAYLIFIRIYNLLQKVIKIEILPAINNIGGLLFGFCKGFAFSTFIAVLLLLIPLNYITRSVKENSRIAPFFISMGAGLYKKSIGVISEAKTANMEQILSGAEPLRFNMFRIKKRDRFEETLE
ncbi:MAG: CvpA family protein [Candidatus Omnitrophota bacterium]|nr:CvpA family protein [Candidatus Omnitrophota bacterium]